MRRGWLAATVLGGSSLAAAWLGSASPAHAQGEGIGGAVYGNLIAPTVTSIPTALLQPSGIMLCPGVGITVSVVMGGGGFCDFNFMADGAHIHCEWGGFSQVANASSCWRVFHAQPDHPKLPDPDVIPDGWTPSKDALAGPGEYEPNSPFYTSVPPTLTQRPPEQGPQAPPPPDWLAPFLPPPPESSTGPPPGPPPPPAGLAAPSGGANPGVVPGTAPGPVSGTDIPGNQPVDPRIGEGSPQ